MTKIINATISNCALYSIHGFLTLDLYLEFGDGSITKYGGVCLAKPGHEEDYAGRYFLCIMKTLGIDNAKDLTGTNLRAELSSEDRTILRIGHIKKDIWFDHKQFFRRIKGE